MALQAEPTVGQYWKGKFHHKVIKVLDVDSADQTILAELQVPGGGGQQWPVQWETLDKSYKLLDEHENTQEGSMIHGAAKLNIP